MPDISMCPNNNCPSRDDCYRFSAKPKEYFQSWNWYAPDSSGKCADFIPLYELAALKQLGREIG